jgi:anaerobic selenocysteine-containing dehydrogenase
MVTLSSTPIASTYHQVKVGGDAAALKGVMKAVIACADAGEKVLDRDFISAHTNGFEAFAEDLRQTRWEAIETACGLDRGALARVADAYMRSNATIVSYGMGITQHEKGTQNVQQIAALLLMRGNFGKPGAGICPLRGHSNAGAQSVTVEDSMSMVHASRGKLEPVSEYLRSEPAIIAGVAMATLPASKVDWQGMVADYDLIRDKIEAVYPDFRDYNARPPWRLPLAARPDQAGLAHQIRQGRVHPFHRT